MPSPSPSPDEFFLAEFGEGPLSSRLWRGGLRATPTCYTLLSGPRALSNALSENIHHNPNQDPAQNLVNELETAWLDPARLQRACNPLEHYNQQSLLPLSLAKLLLSIDPFQPPLITCIINKISEYADTDLPLATTLLNQLRWLDCIVDAPALCESLLAIVPIVPPPLQRVIIESLPEILDDSTRDSAVTELVNLLSDSPSMMGSIVDALAALGVHHDRLPDVNTSILATLTAANPDMLPVTLKYLLTTCPPPLLTRTITVLRQTLALPSLGPAAGRLCLDAVRAALRMTKPVADHAIKMLKQLDDPSQHKPSDVWLLIALLDSPVHRKAAEILFRKKSAKRLWSRTLLDAALAPFSGAFEGLSNRLLDMCGIAMRAAELGGRQTGVILYALVFRLFPSGSTRRNVVMALLDHVGTRKMHEVDAALEALVLISREGEDNRSLLPHSASIQGLLDFLEFFSDSQLRQIWTILGYLCRASAADPEKQGGKNSRQESAVVESVDVREDEADSELAMLEILLRKELYHVDLFYRRIGVLGACTMVSVLGNSVKHNILNMLLEVGRQHPLSQALAFDELAQVLGEESSNSREITQAIRKKISAEFEKKYVTDKEGLGALTKVEDLLPAEPFGNLEGEDVEFCFSISKIVRDEKTLQEGQDAIRAMVPNLRLLCVLTSKCFRGSLTEIDAIIGAPLHLPVLTPDKNIMELTNAAKADLLLSLFVAHGWLVELLNGFAGQESAEIRAKCVRRVDELLLISTLISKCVSCIPLWREVLFDSYNGSRLIATGQRHRAPPSKYGKSSKGNRTPRDGKELQSTTLSQRGNEWCQFARQLTPSALSLLRITSPITWRFTETESEHPREGDPIPESVSLSGRSLLFLLSELAAHVDSLTNNDLRDPNSFCATLFRLIGAGNTKSARGGPPLEPGTDGKLKKFRAMRTALTALGAQLSRCMKKLLPGSDDEDVGDEASLEMHRGCIELCLQSVALSLHSKTLADPAAEDLLFTVLASFRLDGSAPLEASDPFTSADILIAGKHAFRQLRQKLQNIMSNKSAEIMSQGATGRADEVGLHGCSAFLATMETVFQYSSEIDREALGPQLSNAAYSLLQHKWDSCALRARKTQKLIPGIVKLYVQNSADPFQTLEDLREIIVKFSEKQSQLSKKPITSQDVVATPDDKPSTLGSLAEQTSNAYAVAILEQYMWLFKKFKPCSYEDPESALEQMRGFVRAELPLYTLARHNQRLLGPVMRAGRALVDIFLKCCVPFLKDHYREHRGSVVQTCKLHQKPTRLLQTFCAHSKYTRDTSLTGLVPPLRKSLELLLYRVKDLMQAHNAIDAFQLGNLKHRDINGEVLSSQQLQYKSESENDSEYSSGEEASDGEDKDGNEDDVPVSKLQRKQRKETTVNVVKQSRGKSGGKNACIKRKSGQKALNKKKLKGLNKSSGDNMADGVGVRDIGRRTVQEEVSEEEEEDDKISSMRGRRTEEGRKSASEQRYLKRRNPLIDDEAGDSGNEEDEDEELADLSQFLDFGEEEEILRGEERVPLVNSDFHR